MILNDKVYINNTLLDLGEAGGVTLEYAVSDPADMAAIYTPGSWTVNLPKSAVNLQAFGFMTEPGVITDAPHIEHPCQVIRNGVPLFDDGKLTVIDVTETINAVITWSTNERLTDLSRSTLRDLEIDKVMEWDPSTFETSEDDNFKWVVDTGYKSAGADGVMNYNARGFRPAVKASYLLGAMLPGLTIGQSYWDRLENTWLMLPTTNGNAAIDDTLSWRAYGSYSNYDPILNVKDPLRQLDPYVSLEHRYLNLLLNQSATGAQFTQLYVPKDGRYRIFGYVRVASTASGASNYNGKFRIMLNLKYEAAEGGGFTPVYENLYYSEYPIATNNVFDVVVDLQAGDLISMSNEYGLTNATLSGDIGFDLDQAYTENTDTGYLLDYPIRENLPEIGCIEFITGLFGMMGLVAQSNGTGINVFSINDVINNADSVDIAGYINDREARQLEYSYGLTANNRLTYADDTNGISFAANTYDKAENVVVELPFAAGNDIALYERGENGEFSLKDSEDAKALARSGSRTIKVIDDHASASAVRDVSVSVFDFVGLDWPTLYATYWGGYKGVFADNQRVVKYKAVIPEAFARALDFSKPVHDGVNRYMLMRVGKYGYTGACELTLAMLDGVEAVTPSGGPVILVDNSVPLMFDTTVVANYAPAGSLLPGKLIRELEEYTGDITTEITVPIDLGSGIARKRKLKDLVGEIFEVIKTSDVSPETDANVYSALRAISEIEKRAISKTKSDTAAELITFNKGIEVGTFTSGHLGTGGAIHVDENGNSIAEFDKLKVRKRAEFFEVLIQTAKHVGGELIVSPANMICNKVEELAGVYRCYFDRGENNEANNEFLVGDQARCNVFTGSGQKYYWRLVTAIGADYIDISKTVCDVDSDAPALGDHIFQLGNQTDPERRSAQIISSYGPEAPSYIQYAGINSFSLVGKSLNKFTGKGNELFGRLHIEEGSTGWTNIDGLPEEFIAANEYAQGLINGIALGTVNLLRNTAFTGDYVSKDLSASDPLASADKLYSDPLKYWTSYGTNSVFVEADSTSGFGVNVNGTLGQPTPKLVAGETYMMSFKAKGSGSLVVGLGTFTISVSLSSTYSEFVLKFVPTETKVYDFYFNGIASIYEPQLERGTIASKWSYSPVDAHKSEERFQAIKYITSAIVDGSVDVIGGLILCNMLQLGNYKDGVLEKVTSGLSGIYNDDDDPAFWSGGTLEDAIRAVMNPDDTEGANAVITHGGKAILNDAIIRGIIYARGGEFFGKVSTSNGGYRVELDPDGTYKLNVYDSIGRRCVAIGLENNTFGTIRFWGYDGETANVVANAQISTAGIIYNYTADAVTYNFAVQAGLTNKMEITATLPLEADAPVGTLCKDVNNFMKVKV